MRIIKPLENPNAPSFKDFSKIEFKILDSLRDKSLVELPAKTCLTVR